MISLQYEAAGSRLAGLVSSFYRFDFEGESFCELERADRAQFRFMLHGAGSYEFQNGHIVPAYPVTIVGPTTAPVNSSGSGPLCLVGWGMEAAGWAALSGNQAEKWIDDAFDAREIFGDAIMELHSSLAAQQEMTVQFELMRKAATNIFANRSHAPFEFTAIVDRWLVDDQEHDLGNLIALTGLSQRQLQRTTKRHYGLPPKKLARKYRALLAAQIIASGDSLDDNDLGLAFYDQSHLVREVKQFTGLTPTQLRMGKAQLTSATMKGRRTLQGSVSKLVSDS